MDKSLNQASFARRFWQYQKERFPIAGHGLMITAFTFSAISYSRICRGVDGFIDAKDFIIGIFASISLFLLVRIFDEFKDQKEDALYRKYLPVPRGLVSLKELRNVGIFIAVLQVSSIAFFQMPMLLLYVLVLVYLCLMGVEFFIPDWLKSHHLVYIGSHMLIIPLIDLYSSGLDWKLEGQSPHWGLAWFVGVSYVNGMVLEFGRKMRTNETEEEGVLSYTSLYGIKKAPAIWIGLMFTTMLLAMGAAQFAGYRYTGLIVLASLFVFCSLPGWLFLSNPSVKKTKQMEYASAAWTASMYLTLGAIPMIKNFIA